MAGQGRSYLGLLGAGDGHLHWKALEAVFPNNTRCGSLCEDFRLWNQRFFDFAILWEGREASRACTHVCVCVCLGSGCVCIYSVAVQSAIIY